jgi:hypothetical protein
MSKNRRVGDEARAVGARPGRHSEQDEGVLQHFEVPARRLVAQGALARERVEVQDAPGRCGDQVEQTRIAADVPHERLGLHLFAQIGVDVGTEDLLPQARVPFRGDPGQGAVRQGAIEPELASQLPREQRVQVLHDAAR